MNPLNKLSRTALVCAALLLALTSTAIADFPRWINYQGQLTRPDGTPLDTTVSITFRLYPETWSVTPIWDEIHDVTTVNGIYSTSLGAADNLPQTFFDDGSMWLGIQVGTDAEMTPRIDLAAVPYAYRIGTIDEAQGGTVTGDVMITGKLNVGSSNTNAGTNAFVTGVSNTASGDYSVVAGGAWCTASGHRGTIPGGYYNTASGPYTTVGGGRYNTASMDDATISGGNHNSSTNYYATVSGGGYNHARGQFSVIAGGGGSVVADSNSAEGNLSVIGGGYHNYATGDAATIAGGYYHTASGGSATIGGGYRNTSTASYATVGGGTYNDATGQYSTIAGGRHNAARGSHSTVGGGGGTTADSNSAIGSYSTIAGGSGNTATGVGSVVGGGRNNSVEDDYSVIGGGGGAIADSGNHLDAYASVIGGGVANWMDNDSLPTYYGVIGGGHYNWVGDTAATVPGGQNNTADGSYSFAAGKGASAWNRGSFVWSDAVGSTHSDADNEFVVGAAGGVKFYTNSSRNAGVRLAAGGTSWLVISDSTKKENRAPVAGTEVLSKLSAMPIDQWNYKHQPDGPKHYGPMAQDFWNAFHLGSDSLGIETLDADGVLFAAVKELVMQNQDLEARVRHLEAALLQLGLNESTKSK